MIDIRLKVFVSVANNLSFTKASKELFKCQPAISRHIHELEEEFDTKLFIRKANSIELTESGKLLLKHAKTILANYENLSFEMNALNEKFEGNLSIGATPTILQFVLPQLLVEFKKLYPNIKITVSTGNTAFVENLVSTTKVDLGLVEACNFRTDLHYTHFKEDELVAFVRYHSPLAKQKVISLSELKTVPLILKDEGTVTRTLIEDQLKDKGENIEDYNIEMSFSDAQSVKGFVENSDTIGILSQISIEAELKRREIKKLKIDGLKLKRPFSLVQVDKDSLGTVKKFKKFLKDFYSK